ncbi:MAG: helix-hairpin-helix domain-containing protein [Burkholderiales bacterium]|nr:MAG: helix-hairpin-helix domain-containing protein [Burkholderiales bacterium]
MRLVRSLAALPWFRWRPWLVGVALAWATATAVHAASIDANTATETQLQAVKGIGPGIARRIVAERRRAGPFADLGELERRVRGIGAANLRRMAASGLAVGPAPRRAAEPGSSTDETQAARRASAPGR